MISIGVVFFIPFLELISPAPNRLGLFI